MFFKARIGILTTSIAISLISPNTFSGKNKLIPIPSIKPDQSVDSVQIHINSTGGVTIPSTKGTQIHPHGTTSCSVARAGDQHSVHCQGKEQNTQLTVAHAPQVLPLDIEANTLNRIEDESGVCHVFSDEFGEDSHPDIDCSSHPGADLFPPEYPHLNSWIRQHDHKLQVMSSPSEEFGNSSVGEDTAPCDSIAVQSDTELLPTGTPDTYTLRVRPGKKRTHTGEHPFVCPVDGCKQGFTQSSALTRHKRIHTGERPFVCPVEGCKKGFTQSGALTRHKRIHTGERPFVCPVGGCKQGFTQSGDLTTHKRIHTGERPFVCPVEGCKQGFAKSSNLTTHKRTHTGERPFVCPVEGCKQGFAKSGDLTTHKRIHTGERPFVCPVESCKKGFTQSSALTRHKRIHTGERPFVCPVEGCKQGFTQSGALTRHKRIHTGERPFVCPVEGCKKGFARSCALTIHKRIHTGERPFVCPVESCKQGFTQSSALTTHKRIHTGNNTKSHLSLE